MFNINSLAQGFGNLYNIRKRRVVHAMKSDKSSTWRDRAQRFEVFRPKHEKPQPSEWLIPAYAAMHPDTILGIGIRGWGQSDTDESAYRTRLARILRRRRAPVRPTARTDEGWVL